MYTINDKGLRVKRCPKCGIFKDETMWSFKDKDHKTMSTYCKDCDRVRKTLAARERFKDKEKRKNESHRQKLWQYGLTQQQYDELMKESNHSCSICQDTKNLVIDHCHKTNKVRGILCWSCNIALGHFKDSKERLSNALTYLCTKSNQNS